MLSAYISTRDGYEWMVQQSNTRTECVSTTEYTCTHTERGLISSGGYIWWFISFIRGDCFVYKKTGTPIRSWSVRGCSPIRKAFPDAVCVCHVFRFVRQLLRARLAHRNEPRVRNETMRLLRHPPPTDLLFSPLSPSPREESWCPRAAAEQSQSNCSAARKIARPRPKADMLIERAEGDSREIGKSREGSSFI